MVFFLPYLSGGVCRAVSLLFSIAHPGERCKQKMEQRRFSLPILGLTALPCGVILYRFQETERTSKYRSYVYERF